MFHSSEDTWYINTEHSNIQTKLQMFEFCNLDLVDNKSDSPKVNGSGMIHQHTESVENELMGQMIIFENSNHNQYLDLEDSNPSFLNNTASHNDALMHSYTMCYISCKRLCD